MKPSKTTLARFAASVLIIGILTQTVFAATFGRTIFFGETFSIDYEGNGTITHMNASQPSRFKEPPTSLLDLNIMRASDLRLRMGGGFPSGDLRIGLRAPANTLVSLSLPSFFLSPFVPVSEPPFDGSTFALNPAATASLQLLIDLHGAENLFLSLSFGGSGSVFITSVVREIAIDIKPDNDLNAINPNSRGVIPVVVLTTNDFDATTVNVDSLRFGATGSEASVERSAFDDVDGDGDLDLVLHFRIQETNIECGKTVALLRGTNLAGGLIGRWNTISTVGCK